MSIQTMTWFPNVSRSATVKYEDGPFLHEFFLHQHPKQNAPQASLECSTMTTVIPAGHFPKFLTLQGSSSCSVFSLYMF